MSNDRRAQAVRLRVEVVGVVQGVGFRPFIFALATARGLSGFVRNQDGRVIIEVEGSPTALDDFQAEVRRSPPPLSRIESLTSDVLPPSLQTGFQILESSRESLPSLFVPPDVATCDQCLAELGDPGDRRFGYPFINCTNCGPRLTIIRELPYDRPRTTMAGFPMCPACLREYGEPTDRRFHAQPVACPACGPSLTLLASTGAAIPSADPLSEAADRLRQGTIGAIKGIGGFHLACDASRSDVVERLRERKHREAKPFAILVANLREARRFCRIDPSEEELLTSPARPIVLLRRLSAVAPGTLTPAAEVAPGTSTLGLMLPYSPLHHLLATRMLGAPLVMTSGNRSDDPMAYHDQDARSAMAGIADFTLSHDRPINLRCDDSVLRSDRRGPTPLRRSRGYAPMPLRLPRSLAKPTLALGAELKSTFALGLQEHAIVSHHLGDLDHLRALEAFRSSIDHYQELYNLRPTRLVCDLHPDLASSHYAFDRARAEGLELVEVQHHHAHMAACMAERGLDGQAIGVVFDGAGLGSDGTLWGGEFLVGGFAEVVRFAHLEPVRLPGGDAASRQPWRMAVAHLLAAGLPLDLLIPRIDADLLRAVGRMVETGVHSPWTSSVGRLFDAVASLCGLRDQQLFEGQAAIELESLAASSSAEGGATFELRQGRGTEATVISCASAVRSSVADLGRGAGAAAVARRFHTGLVEMIAAVCTRAREETGVSTVVLSGGVFQNAILANEVPEALEARGFSVQSHREVPPNDGGLSLGQLAVAAGRDSR